MRFRRKGVFPSTSMRFTVANGVDGIAANLASPIRWAFGGLLLLMLAAFGWHASRGVRTSAGRQTRWALTGLAVVCPWATSASGAPTP